MRGAQSSFRLSAGLLVWLCAAGAHAEDVTPGFPEKVVQWGTQKGDTCEDISKALYGDPRHAALVLRYNRVVCTRGAPLKPGLSLVMPAAVTNIPTARLRSMVPAVQARPAGGGWGDAAAGAPLASNSSVKTLDGARADIQFVDRTRIFLAENTLVVVFGTASQTGVSKLPPPVVMVEEGELKAAISALRGGTAEIAVKGGGRISATSRDTVVEQKAARTTVAVFEGLANVINGGKQVTVPKNFGTRFVGAAPPIQPRPLPPAPLFSTAPPELVLSDAASTGSFGATWSAVDKARAYRVELARDADFEELLLREEVAASTLSFQAQGLASGHYFLRVRAIDNEDFLGIASAIGSTHIIRATLSGGTGSIAGGTITASRYARLVLGAEAGSDLSLDGGPFFPLPPSIDLLRLDPKQLSLRIGGKLLDLSLTYVDAQATIAATSAGEVTVTLLGLDGVEVASRVKPVLLVRRGTATQAVSVTLLPVAGSPNKLTAKLDGAGDLSRLDVVDGRGVSLGSWQPSAASPAPLASPGPEPTPRFGRIGIVGSPFAPNPYVPSWWAPTAPNAMVSSLAFEQSFDGSSPNLQGRVMASGNWGPVGLEGSIFSDDLQSPDLPHESAWLGLRLRMLRLDDSALEAGPAMRLGVPLAGASEVEASFGLAVGGVAGSFTWLFDLAFDLDEGEAAFAYVPSAVGGLSYDWLPWLRSYGTLDVFVAEVAADPRGAFGLTLGAEAGDHVFGGLSTRIAPVDAPLGGFVGALHFGVRNEP